MSELTANGWLKLRRRRNYGQKLTAQWTATRPVLDSDEIAVKVTIRVPDTAFAPQVVAELVVPESAVITAQATVESPSGDDDEDTDTTEGRDE